MHGSFFALFCFVFFFSFWKALGDTTVVAATRLVQLLQTYSFSGAMGCLYPGWDDSQTEGWVFNTRPAFAWWGSRIGVFSLDGWMDFWRMGGRDREGIEERSCWTVAIYTSHFMTFFLSRFLWAKSLVYLGRSGNPKFKTSCGLSGRRQLYDCTVAPRIYTCYVGVSTLIQHRSLASHSGTRNHVCRNPLVQNADIPTTLTSIHRAAQSINAVSLRIGEVACPSVAQGSSVGAGAIVESAQIRSDPKWICSGRMG